MQLAQVAALLASWAARKPLVGRVFLFGSRVRGDHSSNSDLDIAIELDPAECHGDQSGGLATWMRDTDDWQEEIAKMIPLKIDLEQYRGEDTPRILKALAQSSFVIYEKIAGK